MHHRGRSFTRLTALLAFVAITLTAAATLAAPYSPEVQKEARTIFLEMMSPYCPGQSLYSCRSGAAEVLRNQIRDRLAAGETREEIETWLVAEFGESILGAPKNQGFGRLAWIGPIAVLLVGLGMIVRWLRRNSKTPSAEPQRAPDAAITSRVEDELKSHGG